MKKLSQTSIDRVNVRVPPDLKQALNELSEKRFREIGGDHSFQRLVIEGLLLLLHHEGIEVARPKPEPRKPPTRAKGKRAATAVQA